MEPIDFSNICDSCKHYKFNLDKEYCLLIGAQITGFLQECANYEWNEDIAKVPEPKLDIKIEPVTTIPDRLVCVKIPDKPDFIVNVSIWEKIYWIYCKYKSHLDIIIKFTPIALLFLGFINKLKEGKTMFKNWKTSTAGIGAIVFGIIKIVTGDTEGGVALIISGIGLLTAADAPKTTP